MGKKKGGKERVCAAEKYWKKNKEENSGADVREKPIGPIKMGRECMCCVCVQELEEKSVKCQYVFVQLWCWLHVLVPFIVNL